MNSKNIGMLIQIQDRLEQLYPLIEFYNSQTGLSDYGPPIAEASLVIEAIIVLIAYEHGYEYDNMQFINIKTREAVDQKRVNPFQFACSGHLEGIPQEIQGYLNAIRTRRNMAVHGRRFSYDEAVIFSDAFDCLVGWFILNSTTIKHIDDPTRLKFLDRIRSLTKTMTMQIVSEHSKARDYHAFTAAYQAANDITTESDTTETESKVLRQLRENQCYLEQIYAGIIRIEKSVDLIVEKLNEISTQISICQSLLTRQIDMAIDDQERDRIISAYADEMTRRIASEVNKTTAEQAFNAEQEKLLLSLGNDAWNKLDPISQNFLITAKVTYNSLLAMRDAIDYSGVCLLVTKAVELEMSNRFCRDFIEFMRRKYPGKSNYPVYPTALLNRFGKPIRTKDFTLGSVAYVLCYSTAEGVTPEQAKNNHEKLLEFVSECLMHGKEIGEIENHLELISDGVESIRKEYRNPSAHTNQLQCVNAQQCFDLVLDVEKLLKRIMCALDY